MRPRQTKWTRDMRAAQDATDRAVKAVTKLCVGGCDAPELDDLEDRNGESDRDRVLNDAKSAGEVLVVAQRLLRHSAGFYRSLYMPGKVPSP